MEARIIGHYLLQLDEAAEGRILTSKLAPGEYLKNGTRCLVGAAANWYLDFLMPTQKRIGDLRLQYKASHLVQPKASSHSPGLFITGRYDWLCNRFGTERINRVIRMRILTNRLWRTRIAEHQFEASYKPGHSSDLPF